MNGYPPVVDPGEGNLVNIPITDQQRMQSLAERLGQLPDGQIVIALPDIGLVPANRCVVTVKAENGLIGIPPLPVHGVDLLGIVSVGVGSPPQGDNNYNRITMQAGTVGKVGFFNAGHSVLSIRGGEYPQGIVSLEITWKADATVNYRSSLAITVLPDFQGKLDLKLNIEDSSGLLLVLDNQDTLVSPIVYEAMRQQEPVVGKAPDVGVLGMYRHEQIVPRL